MKIKQILIVSCLLAGFLSALTASATPSFYPTNSGWTPLFRGIDRATGTNFSGGSAIFAHALRIDLTEPGVQLLATPKTTNFPGYEVLGMSVSNFVKTYKLQVGINANDFNNTGLNEGEPANLNGISISRGVIVSPQDSSSFMATVLFATSNVPSIVLTNSPPGTNTAGVYTAVTGMFPLVWNGVNMCVGGVVTGLASDSSIHQKQPRTTVGYSQDKRYLYLVCVDGRQSPFSNGSTDQETADMMILFGVYQGVNMDGGGSATMVRANAFGIPIEENRSSDSIGTGHERVVGSHLGVYALPLPGFINDVAIAAQDTSATITWATISNATSQVEYGTTTSLGTFSESNSIPVTNHSVTLTGLTSGATYYFRAISVFGGSPFYSSNYFTTTNNTITVSTQLFTVTKSWKWNTNNLDGVNWKATNYNDSTWSSGAGLLYVENNFFVSPKNTALPPNNGNPVNGVGIFQTYYFRTTFTYSNPAAGTALFFTNYVDDGAVFYLNGAEIQRLRMAASPTVITNKSVATGSPGSGDATSADVFTVSGNILTNLVMGTNVLAVEVHQVAPAGNTDVVFGTSLGASYTYSILVPKVDVAQAGNVTTLSWPGSGYTLQQATQMNSISNLWIDVPGPVTTSPFSVTNPAGSKFFRLRN